jgi:CBS domain-containing protein
VLMRKHHVGTVVVIKEKAGKVLPLGIVTDRDIVLEVVASQVAPGMVTVGEIMTETLVTAREDEGVYEGLERMRSQGIRRMPVVDKSGGLVGIVTLDDLLDILAEEMTEIVKTISREQYRENQSRKDLAANAGTYGAP